ncbi:hypothetical protein [Candidatus Paracaedibacter symbiosus]|uniref:hypothetical protein n=1 Tax=Candidatus Paracaedibacter symbiosus TaxID=244582 RepID=UPI000509FFD5|nr:hypothetical protein [Candidatus Paracaedibacter symbiosus]
MKKLVLASLLSVSFLFTATASEPTKPAEAPKVTTEAAQTVADTKVEPKTKTHSRMTKEERLAHNNKEADNLMTSLTEKVKTMTGADKKMVELNMAHAKLEMDAAKDDDMKTHTMAHLNKAKRFLKIADKFASKAEKPAETKGEEKKADDKKADAKTSKK